LISFGQATASSGTASSLCVVPPGPCLVILNSDPASAATAYIATTPSTGGSISSTNGIPLAAGASMTFAGYPGAKGSGLSFVAAGTASATVGWMISRG
jgi:hypothetical protein